MEITQKPNGYLSFQLSLPWKKLQNTYQQLLVQAAKTIEIKGFRKGKAPLSLVEKQLDTQKLYLQAAERLLPQAYLKVIRQHHLHPLIDPKITPLKTNHGKSWTFKVETAQKPAIKLGNYQVYLKKAVTSVKSTKNDKKLKDKKLQALFDALLKNIQIDITDLLIDQELQTALSKLIHQLSPLNISLQDYAKSLKKTLPELIQEYRQTALNNLKLEFALSELVNQEKPPVSDKELNKNQVPANQRPYLKYLLQKQKVIDKFLEL